MTGTLDARSGSTVDPETLAAYDARADDYASRMQPQGDTWSLRRFLELAPPGSRVLDYGCGAGWASVAMIASGCSVRAIDASAGLVREARARGVPAEIGVFEDLDEDDEYDAVWASFSLLHAPRAALPGLLDRVRRALKPNGVFYLGVKLGEGEVRDELGRRYAYWSEHELKALIADAGFTFLEATVENEMGWAGRLEPQIHLFARG